MNFRCGSQRVMGFPATVLLLRSKQNYTCPCDTFIFESLFLLHVFLLVGNPDCALQAFAVELLNQSPNQRLAFHPRSVEMYVLRFLLSIRCYDPFGLVAQSTYYASSKDLAAGIPKKLQAWGFNLND